MSNWTRLFDRAYYHLARRAGTLTANLHLCRITMRRHKNGQVFYLKKRRPEMELVVRAGNVGCSLTRAPLYGLPDRLWLDWEIQLARQLYGEVLQARSGTLIRAALPGRTLAYLWRDESLRASEKAAALQIAIQSLRTLHATPVLWPGGQVRPLSHADAHACNVMVHLSSNTARWFDFEALHDVVARSAAWRHADDLRALAYSLAALTPTTQFDSLAHLIVNAYGTPEVLRELHSRALRLQSRPDAFHLSQFHLSHRRHTAFSDALLKVLEL